MATKSKMIIAFDIGGVVKDHSTDLPIDGAVEAILKLAEDSSKSVIFISKCKESYQEKTNTWLRKYNLEHIPTHFCLEYAEKVPIAEKNHVDIIVDDRMQVLCHFPASIMKIWFCSNPKNIEGARKFQPEFFNSVRIARDWNEVIDAIEEIP